jgi:hypothetical protein
MDDPPACPDEYHAQKNIEEFSDDMLCAILQHISQRKWHILALVSNRWNTIMTAVARMDITTIYNTARSVFRLEHAASDLFVWIQLISGSQVVSAKLFVDTQQTSVDYVSDIVKIADGMAGLAKYLYDKYVHGQDDKTQRQKLTEKICNDLISATAYHYRGRRWGRRWDRRDVEFVPPLSL